MNKQRYWIGLSLSVIMLVMSACSSSTIGGRTNGTTVPNTGEAGKTISPQETGTTPESSPKGGKKTIVFSSFYLDNGVKEAKIKYEAAHPNITIDLRHVETDDAHAEAELKKYVTATNTAMLSGKGPDMLTLDTLPSEKYVGQHLLADLSEMLKKNPSFIKGDYYNNILENSHTNGALYGLPLAFFLNVMIGDEGAIKQSGVQIDDKNWTWEKYAETLKQLSQKEPFKSGRGGVGNMIVLPPKTKQEPMQALLREMVKENYTRFVNEDRRTASFESKAFTDMMAQVKKLVDDGLDLSSLSSMFRTDNVNSASAYLVMIKESGKQARLYAKPRAEGTKAGGYFYPYQIIGINEKSTVKQEALDFLQFLMSEELQSTAKRAGFPINKKAYEKQVQQLLTKGTIKAYEEGPLKGQSFPVDPAQIKVLEDYLTGAIHPVAFQPSKIEEIVFKESQAFFSGQKSAPDVAKLIQNKVTTYLNE
ncbi:ABC transporter substrate-binding protein [Paenibacillus sp. N3.4]|uniref:ABC transporter substrate-binding protein n=1 Tax=Paenibacillus sp. N3.4 TaxID=2603222 RepID=UPI0011C9413F|nr:ABC transporter substrate-binding protein [Paenibacillus sp. N3.4]TXK84289.1 carbohydrate ABC transporter substrate-binding protein [Paenibacillus sp. N3.4]